MSFEIIDQLIISSIILFPLFIIRHLLRVSINTARDVDEPSGFIE